MPDSGPPRREYGPSKRPFGKKLRVGVVDIIYDAGATLSWFDHLESQLVFKQYAAIMPQVVKVWCKQLGCEVFYKTFYSQCDLFSLVPDDLDVIFITCCSQESHLAYGLSRYYQKKGTTTVLGGPHAHCFPSDAKRFFDVVVGQTNKDLVEEILRDRPKDVYLESAPPTHFPGVEERMEDIIDALFYFGKPMIASTIPIYASVGCPYTCNFCVDYNSKYRTLDTDALEADLRYINTHHPNATIGFHDANFAVRFDETMDVLERVGNTNGYGIGITMSVLNTQERIMRLKNSGCRYVQCGIESLSGFHGKQGRKRVLGLNQAREGAQDFFENLSDVFEMTQCNIIFGLEDDMGTDIVDQYVQFVESGAAGIINMCIPTPFAQTPLYDTLIEEDRVLPMPFLFYRDSYLSVIPKHYDAKTYYQHMITILKSATSNRAIYNRLASPRFGGRRKFPFSRNAGEFTMRLVDRFQFLPTCQRIFDALEERDMADFYAGKTKRLPNFFRQEFQDRIKRVEGLVTPDEIEFPSLEPARVNPPKGLRVV